MNENFYLNCSIDLKGNVLRIGTTGTETPFLAESELPEYARLSGNSVEEAVRQSIREMEDEALQKALEDSAKTNSAGPDGEGGGNGQRSSSSPTGNPGKAPAPDISPEDNFTESDVKEIEGMGFGREEILAELRRFRGDKIQAIAALFAKSLKF